MMELERVLESIHRGRLEEFLQLIREASSSSSGMEAALSSINSSILDYIITHDRHDFLDLLIERYPALLTSKTKKQQTFLHLAVSNPSLRILDFLLVQQADNKDFINATNQWNETCLHVAAGIGHIAIVQKLIQADVDQSIVDQWGRTAADIARESGHTALLSDDLLHIFQSSDKAEDDSNRGTNEAPIVKQQVVVNEFMTALSSLKARHQDGSTSTSIPSVVVKTIFSQIQEKLSFQETEGEKLILTSHVVKDPLQSAQSHPIAAPIKRKTALSKILEYPGDLAAIKTAVEAQSADYDINGKDMFGLTALHKVASWDVVDILQYLLQQSEVDVNVVIKAAGDQLGFTALHCAIDMNALRSVSILVADARVDVRTKDQKGRTALDLAIARTLPDDIIQQLRSK